MGVFATRSPFRPNPIGLSSVRLVRVELQTPEGPVLHISGADLMDGTPILDIKPYLAYTDAHPDAAGGFAYQVLQRTLPVDCPPALLACLPETGGTPCSPCLRRTRARAIRMNRAGYTGSRSRASRCALP